MLRKIKTDLTPDDLHKPVISVDDAVTTEGGNGSVTGALLLPEDEHISKSLAAPVAPRSNDWMLKGDPTAPALKDLEARAAAEREAAMQQMAATAQPVMQVPLSGGAVVAAPMPVPATAVTPEDSTRHFPWAASAPTAKPAQPDDLPTIWDKPLPEAAPVPVAPAAPMQHAPDLTGSVIPATYTYAAPAPIPTEQPIISNGEVVIKIDHSSPSMAATSIIGREQKTEVPMGGSVQADSFATGSAVKIPHDPQLQSLPYNAPAAAKPANRGVL
jgi:hypothetical protein